MATQTLRVTFIVAGSSMGIHGNPDLGELYAQVMQRCPKCSGSMAPLLKPNISKSLAASHYWKAGCFCVQCNLHAMPTPEIQEQQDFSRSTSGQDDGENGVIATPPAVEDCPVISADSLPKNVRGTQKVWENSLDKEFSHFLACIKKHVTDQDKRLQEQQLELCRREKTLQVMSETVARKLQGIRQRENVLAEKEKRLFILKETIIAKDLDNNTSSPPFNKTPPRTFSEDAQHIEPPGFQNNPAHLEGRHDNMASWSHEQAAPFNKTPPRTFSEDAQHIEPPGYQNNQAHLEGRHDNMASWSHEQAAGRESHSQVPALNHETLYHIRSLSEDSTVPPRSDFGSTDFPLANEDFQFDRPSGHRNVPQVGDISNIPPKQSDELIASPDSIYPDVFSPPSFRRSVNNGFADVKKKPDIKFTSDTSETASEFTSTNAYQSHIGTENESDRNTIVDSANKHRASTITNSRNTVIHDESTRDIDQKQKKNTRNTHGKQTFPSKLAVKKIKPTVSSRLGENSLKNGTSNKNDARERKAAAAQSADTSSHSTTSVTTDFHSYTFPRNRNTVSRQPSVCLKGIVSNTRKMFESNTLPRNKTSEIPRRIISGSVDAKSASKLNKDKDVSLKHDKKDRVTDKKHHIPNKSDRKPDKKDQAPEKKGHASQKQNHKILGSSTAPYRGYRAYDGPLFTQKVKGSKGSEQKSALNTLTATEPPKKPPRLTSSETELTKRDSRGTDSLNHNYIIQHSKNTPPQTFSSSLEGTRHPAHKITGSKLDIPSYSAKGPRVHHKATKSNITEYTTAELNMPTEVFQSRAWYAADEDDSHAVANKAGSSASTDIITLRQERDIGQSTTHKPTSPTSTLKKIQERLRTQEERNTVDNNQDINRSLSPERLEFWKSYLHQEEDTETTEPPPRPPKYRTYSSSSQLERNEHRETSDDISGNTWPKHSSNVRRVTML